MKKWKEKHQFIWATTSFIKKIISISFWIIFISISIALAVSNQWSGLFILLGIVAFIYVIRFCRLRIKEVKGEKYISSNSKEEKKEVKWKKVNN